MTERDFSLATGAVVILLQFFTVVAWLSYGLSAAALVFVAMACAWFMGAGHGITGTEHGFFRNARRYRNESRRKR